MPLYKESFLEDRIYQELQELKLEGIKIERSSNIRGYRPDIVLLNSLGYFAVIEIKRSLENPTVLDRACSMVRHYMELTKASYGYVTDGKTTFFIESNGQKETVELYAHIKSLLKDYNQKKEIDISAVQLDDLKRKLQTVYADFKNALYISAVNVFIEQLRITDFVQNNNKFSFTEEKERKFMGYLLGHYSKDSLCRYTSMAGLFRTLDSKKHSMVCLVGMNDKGETDYVHHYMRNKGNQDYLSTPVSKLNDLFILSCCDEQKEDDLTMFRLYGDDSRGVCLKYGIKGEDKNKEFFIAPVSYANADGSHPKLDFFMAVSQIVQFRHSDAWLHFFKSYDYQVENEVRVLYERNNRNKKWVNISSYGIICPVVEFDENDFPLSLDKILLGPNCPEKNVNISQIETMVLEKNIAIKYGVSLSEKDSYRVSG